MATGHIRFMFFVFSLHYGSWRIGDRGQEGFYSSLVYLSLQGDFVIVRRAC